MFDLRWPTKISHKTPFFHDVGRCAFTYIDFSLPVTMPPWNRVTLQFVIVRLDRTIHYLLDSPIKSGNDGMIDSCDGF